VHKTFNKKAFHLSVTTLGVSMKIICILSFTLLVCAPSLFAQEKVAPQNIKILEYIGEPVVYKPQSRDYTAETMLNEFKAACEKVKVKLSVIKIDTTEYPYLIYGAWSEESKYTELRSILATYKPEVYSFQGSVGGSTNFAVDITPYKAHPRELFDRIHRRTTIRMAVLVESLKIK
jgi:hypothetical protein